MNLNATSYTELSLLADCEKKWEYRYVNRVRSDQSVAQARGSAIHEAVARWWDDPTLPMAVINPWPEGRPEDPEEVALVEWLLKRYEEHHGPGRRAGSLRMIGHELYFEHPVPGTNVMLRAYVDGLGLDADGQMWLVERKTMKDWQRLDLLEVDQQISLYIWLAQVIGLPVKGVIFDAIRTFRWKLEKPTLADIEADLIEHGLSGYTKKGLRELAKQLQEEDPGVERPAAESFHVAWLDRSPEHIAEALADVQAGAQRRALLANGARPLRNLGRSCGWCDHKPACWAALSFGIEIEPDF